jgi:hypothetical protein
MQHAHNAQNINFLKWKIETANDPRRWTGRTCLLHNL